jgi:hypothetical protein
MSQATDLLIKGAREEFSDDPEAQVVITELEQVWRNSELASDFAAKLYWEQRASNLLFILDTVG